MEVISITESGSSNILLWAIKNGANIKEDTPLVSLINDELFYLVTLSDINLFELFRLTQMYREKLRICDENPAELPSQSVLSSYFPGEYTYKNDDDEEKKVPLSKIAEDGIKSFLNLASQMATDDDIIRPGVARLFLPMISRKFCVQIPVSFIDILDSMSETEASNLFTTEYPSTLNSIISTDNHGVKNILGLGFVKGTQIIKYDKRYDQYLKAIKYSPLKNYKGNKLYKFALLGFSKRNNISRSEERLSLFKSNTIEVQQIMKQISRLNTPLELDFVIQLPIQHMQILENSFGRDIINIAYESSMSTILDSGLIYEDFKVMEYIPENEDDEKLVEYNNSIDAYRIRIAESNSKTIKSLPILLGNSEDVDITSVFSILPSIYMTNAVITIKSDDISKLIKGSGDTIISDMFEEISDIIESVITDIRKSK